MTTAPEDPGLLSVTVAALQSAGRMVQTDWDVATFTILPVDPADVPVTGIVLTGEGPGIVLHAVWPDFVPGPARDAVAEWSVRANTRLSLSAIEFDPGTGTLSVRAAVNLSGLSVAGPEQSQPTTAVTLPRAGYATLLIAATDEVTARFAELAGQVHGLLAAAAPDGGNPDIHPVAP